MPGPHDALFKAAFGEPAHAAGELRAVLPPDVVAALDLRTLRRVPGSFVDAALAERHTDVLFAVDTVDGRVAYVYVLLEHQSTVDPLMPHRILGYLVRIWEAHVTSHEHALPLPPIVATVVSHAPGGWTAATRFEDVVALDGPLAAFAPFTPSFGFALDDLATVPDEVLLRRRMTAWSRVVLVTLKHVWTDSGAILRAADLVRQVLRARDGERVLLILLSYAYRTARDRERLLAVAAKIHEKVFAMAMTIADQLIQEGLEKGQRAVLLRQLAHRFGPLPAHVAARVDAASPDDLGRWAERLLDVAALDDVFCD